MKKLLFIALVSGFVATFAFASGTPEQSSKSDKTAYDLRGLGPSVHAYTTEADAWALAAKGPTIYMFAATWCPFCQGTTRNIRQDQAKIPANYSIIYVNFDNEDALKKKYGVAFSSTQFLIDPQGNKLKLWVWTTSVDEIVRNMSGK